MVLFSFSKFSFESCSTRVASLCATGSEKRASKSKIRADDNLCDLRVWQSCLQKKCRSYYLADVGSIFCGKGEDNEEEPVRKEATERGGDTVTVTVAEAKVSEEPKTKPKRSTIEGWLATYKWLICEPDKPMFCSVCLIGGEKNAFTSGCSNYKMSALKEHVEGSSLAIWLYPAQCIQLGVNGVFLHKTSYSPH